MKRVDLEGDGVHTYVRRVPHAPAKVFRALTDEVELSAWFPVTVSGDVGETALEYVDERDGAKVRGRVHLYEPPHRLEYTLGDETLRWHVSPAPGGSVVVLVTEPANDAPANDTPANDTTKAVLARAA